MMDQSRWYYNFYVSIFTNTMTKQYILSKQSFGQYKVRDMLTQYEYVEESDSVRYFQRRIHFKYALRGGKTKNTNQMHGYHGV